MTPTSKPDPPNVCALCLRERALCDSHIIPEFMHKPGYDAKHRLVEIDAKTGLRGPIQKGYREPLLCEDCEGFLNRAYEKPFCRAWYELDLVRRPPPGVEIAEFSGINYAPFKLLHLSILWRAGAARGPGFENVRLGAQHEERLRLMVRWSDPGEPDEYPVVATALTTEDGDLAHGLIGYTTRWRYQGLRLYSLVYGGFEWSIGVGSHCPAGVRRMALQRDGTMRMPVQRWTDNATVRRHWIEHLSARRDRPAG